MSGPDFLTLCAQIALAITAGSMVLVLIRLWRGPTLSDRILCLDVLVSLGIGFICGIAILTGYYLYLDIALTLGLVGFLATVAFARFVLFQGTKRPKTTAIDSIKAENGPESL